MLIFSMHGRDIVAGKSNQDKPCKAGFAPAKGWDPVTGLGSPVWGNLLKSLA